jgi:hypothetical protein
MNYYFNIASINNRLNYLQAKMDEYSGIISIKKLEKEYFELWERKFNILLLSEEANINEN